jgi:hypothetical protein
VTVWEIAVGPVVAAIIAGPMMWLLRRFDKNNSQQHHSNMDVLVRIEGKVDKIDERVDDHISWHLDK